MPPQRRAAKLAGVSTSSSSDILWQGAPQPGAYVVRRLWPAWPVALLTLIVGVWWEYQAIFGHHLIVYPLLGWTLPVLGFYGSVVHPLLLWRTARRTRYVVRADGLMVSWGERSEQRWQLAAAALPPARLVPAGRGLSDVWLDGPGQRASRWGWWQIADDRPLLSCLADGAAAERALTQLRQSALQAGAAPGDWAAAIVTPGSSAVGIVTPGDSAVSAFASVTAPDSNLASGQASSSGPVAP